LGDVVGFPALEVQNVLVVPGSPTLLCILGSRMVFNLKEAGEADYTEDTIVDFHKPVISNILFEEAYNEGIS
jgi:hypothetical protein